MKQFERTGAAFKVLVAQQVQQLQWEQKKWLKKLKLQLQTKTQQWF